MTSVFQLGMFTISVRCTNQVMRGSYVSAEPLTITVHEHISGAGLYTEGKDPQRPQAPPFQTALRYLLAIFPADPDAFKELSTVERLSNSFATLVTTTQLCSLNNCLCHIYRICEIRWSGHGGGVHSKLDPRI